MAEERGGLLHLECLRIRLDALAWNRRKSHALALKLICVEGSEDLEIPHEEILRARNVRRNRRDWVKPRGEGGRAVLRLAVDEEEDLNEPVKYLGEARRWRKEAVSVSAEMTRAALDSPIWRRVSPLSMTTRVKSCWNSDLGFFHHLEW